MFTPANILSLQKINNYLIFHRDELKMKGDYEGADEVQKLLVELNNMVGEKALYPEGIFDNVEKT